MKTMKRMLCFVMVITMVAAVYPDTATAKTKIKLNKKKITLKITDKKKNPTATLKVKGLSKKDNKKVKWSTSDKKIATVKKGKVTAKSAGKAVITCKVKGKKYTCKVMVVDKRTDNTDLKMIITEKASESEQAKNMHFPTRELMIKFANDLGVNPELSLQAEGGPGLYTVNKFKITYKGKDVTNEAEYKVEMPRVGRYTCSGDASKIAKITSPGVINVSTDSTAMPYFDIMVSYKNVKRTFQMKKFSAGKGTYALCKKCGEPYEDVEGAVMEHVFKQLGAVGGGCSNYWVVKFAKALDIEFR